MTTSPASSPASRLAGSAFTIALALIASSVLLLLPLAAVAQVPASGPKIWLQDSQPLPVQHVPAGQGAAITNLAGLGGSQPVSMAAADLDGDGFQDLVIGYSAGGGGFISVHRGNIDAFAPQSDASFQAIGRGEFPAPFLLEAQTFSVPVSPDFVVIGDFFGRGNQDLAVGANGGTALYLFPGDGKGNFGDPQALNVGGGLTSLAEGEFGSAHQPTLIAGVAQNKNTSSLLVFAGSAQGLTQVASLPVAGQISNILFGDFGSGPDAAFLAGGKVQILRSSTLSVVTVQLQGSAVAFALGSFLFDRNSGSQIAVLNSDGSVQIAARSEFDPQVYTIAEFNAIRQANRNHQPAPAFVPARSFPMNGWKIVESFPGVATITAGKAPLFFRTRVSSNGPDDIMWLGASSGQMAVISHDNAQPGAPTFAQGQVSIKPYNGSPVAALPLRINVDGRPGILALHQGEIAPSMLMPIPDPTFFPNRFDDIAPRGTGVTCLNTTGVDASGDCTLREAIIKANATAGTDNIQLQAGTYTLTRGRTGVTVAVYDAQNGTLNINDSVNLVGAVDGSGNPASIITWGTLTSGISVDMVMSVNEDINPITNATASISNVVIQNGVNHGQHGNDGDGGCMEYDTGSAGTATLSLTNVTIQNCATTFGNGGGIVIFNFITPNGGGFPTITNSIIQNNTAVDGTAGVAGAGGGIGIAAQGQLVMSNSQVLNNKAVQSNTQHGTGGGIAIENQLASSRLTTIHSSTISGNKSAGFGGGIWDASNLTIDQGTVISNNIAGTDGTNPVAGQEGGGLYGNTLNNGCPACTDKITLTKVTITGNSATGNGGGISNGNNSAFPSAGSLTMNFSRLVGNTTSGGSGNNLNNNGTTASVTNDWWGTNAASSTIHTINSGATTFDPFIVLTHTSSPHPIKINGTTTLTADMSKDNHGNGAALSGNLDRIVGLPITFDGALLGTIPGSPLTQNLGNPIPTTTSPFNAGATSGLGDAVATLEKGVAGAENYAVHVNTNLIASATESGTTATITTVGAHGFTTSDYVNITGVTGVGTCSGYNGTNFHITGATTTTFTYTATGGLSTCSGGTASIGLVVLEPPQITKTFSPKTIQTTTLNAGSFSTITFTLKNNNAVPIDSSFNDNLPTVGGPHPGSLVVATPNGMVNNCGGTVTATAGSGSISFSNGSLPVGTCTITVNVSSAVDDIYSNSVTIDSTDAGNGNTSSDSLNVIDPPHANKTVGQPSIPFGATTSLSIQLSNTNQNQTLSAITFTDTLPNNAPGTLVVATPNGLTNTCSAAATAIAGSGSVSLASSSLAPGASCTVSANVQGTKAGAANNSVTASDTTAGSGNTSTAPLTVVKADTTTTVTSSQNPSVFGQSVTFTATVSAVAPGAGTPTGVVTFLDGGSPIGTGTLSGGVATFTTSALAIGNHTITTSYAGDGNFNGSTGSLTGNPQVVNKADTATTVTSSVNPSVFGQSVTFTATVSAVAPGSGTPTGTVTFLDGGSPIGTGTLSGGIATFTTSALAVVNHTITTSYGGDGNFNGNTGSLTGNPQVVNKADTSSTVTSSLNPSVFGQSVTFTATVSAIAPGSGTPTGTVTFLDGGSPIGTGTLSGGIATFTTSALTVGNHTITTTYGGDGNFNGNTGSLIGNPQVVNKADTTSTVTSSLNPSVFGQSVTFTATVSAVAPASGTPTGTVTFLDGGSPIGTGTLSGGVATFTTSALAVGNHTITTSYGGDGNFNGSTGSLTGNPQVVNKADTTTIVTSSVNPSVFGQAVTFTATVSPVAPGAGTPTGTVTFLDGGSPIGTGTLSGGIATFTTSALGVGNHTITTSYGGDGNFNGSTGSLTGNPQVVNKANTITTVISSVNPSVFGQSVTFSATVSAVAPGAGTPTGTVTFLDGGSPIGTGTLSGGIATFTTSALAVGNHTITTTYGGDGNFNGSTGSLTGNPQVVNKADTSTTVTSSKNPALLGQPVTFTATVSAVAPGSGTPTGTVTFLDNGSPIGTGTLSGGVATFTTSALALGNHTITTTYGGDGNFNGSTGSLTGNPQVVSKADTTTTVVSSLNPSVFGQSVTFTATVSAVSPGTGTPTGTVTFLDGGSPIGTATLSGGIATFTTSALAAGNHTITTSYGGDGNFNGSTGSLTGNPQVVNKADTTTIVTSSLNPSIFGQSVTFTAAISPVAPGAGTPTGTVTFLDGGSPIGTATLSGGIAAFTTSALAVGNHTITTSYGGDGNFNGSTGSLTGNPQVVNKANTTTTVTSSVNPSVFGQPVTFTATVSPVAPAGGTPTGTVTFLDGGSPIGTATLSGGIATFTTSALAVGNHTITTSYGGDGNFNGSTGSLTGNPQVVNKANTATTVVSSQNPALVGQPVTFTATVSPVAPGAGTPTGTVTFLDGGSPIGTGTLSGGIAAFTTSALALGNHTITTSYGGDGNFNGSTGSLTGNPQVISKANTTTAVVSSKNPSALGQSVTFTATVSAVAPGTGTPTGTVTFLDGGSTLGTGTLSGGVASFTTSALAAGNHTITTNYSGDANFNGGTGSLTGNPQVVVAPPSIAKSFNPSAIAPNGVSALTFTITNPAANTIAEAGVAFSDTLPANLVVATPNGVTNTCGGTVTATAGSGSISLTGGTVAVASSCTVSVNVTSSVPGTYHNTSGAVSSTNGGTGNTASATLTVAHANLSITKVHNGTFHRGQTGATYTITVSNGAAAGPTDGTTVTVTDTLPNVQHTLVPTGLSGTGWSCNLGTLTCTRSDVLAAGASYPAITLTVNIPQDITNSFTNTVTVSGGGDPNSHQGTDKVTLGPPVLIQSMDSGSATIPRGGAATFLFQVDTSGVDLQPTVVAFACSGLPVGTACIFSPLATGQAVSQMTLTVTSLGHSARLGGNSGIPPLYAALLFPVAGLVGLGFAGRKGKNARSRLAIMLMGLLLLAALAGCGGNPLITPQGQSTVTVTATATSSTGPVSGSTTVSLTVQ